ncbi:glycosyltransferase family 2 protein [uncultured Thiodictyon sp.]|uniref:glycosyltransferase family 2 protein n=1 Tax=uncultured Thiodictyon sp. TaxID=1846217 RepID=UPI0025FDDDEC|nr:glycosyltransferase family 2 protein [uncultured Thiodictyon sp.]
MHRAVVSVVMSVYNGARHLPASIDSVLVQDGVDFEFIVVDDGSTDETPRILQEYAAADPRIRLVHQLNQGLTRALIRGCREATGEFIARQDVGDVSLPGRLKKELDLICSDPRAVLASCGTRFVGPGGEPLFEVLQSAHEASAGLQTLDAAELQGPSCHPCVLFRKSAYFAVGGYRHQFRVAQDIDLWVRLAEIGKHLVVPEVLFQAEYSLTGISPGRHAVQQRIGERIIHGARLRRAGLPEDQNLQLIERIVIDTCKTAPNTAEAAYFIASCLMRKEPAKAKTYFATALRANPFHFKALMRYLQILARRP